MNENGNAVASGSKLPLGAFISCSGRGSGKRNVGDEGARKRQNRNQLERSLSHSIATSTSLSNSRSTTRRFRDSLELSALAAAGSSDALGFVAPPTRLTSNLSCASSDVHTASPPRRYTLRRVFPNFKKNRHVITLNEAFGSDGSEATWPDPKYLPESALRSYGKHYKRIMRHASRDEDWREKIGEELASILGLREGEHLTRSRDRCILFHHSHLLQSSR